MALAACNIVAGRYKYLSHLLYFESCQPTCTVPQWPPAPSPVIIANWSQFLSLHPDTAYAAYIHNGFVNGFRIGFDRTLSQPRSVISNHPSAASNPAIVREFISSECLAGRLVGPVPSYLASSVHTSPIGLVPKSGRPGRWRLIVDLSSPPNQSVNSGIRSDVKYASVDQAVDRILLLGQNTELIKIDLKDAYRIVPVHPHDHHLLGILWQGCTYVDRVLPFGLRSAPKIFSAVSDAIAWALYCANVEHQIHYLDDFLFFSTPGLGAAILSNVLSVLALLGVPISAHKTEGPSSQVTFLGILIDTHRFQLRLLEAKLLRLQSMVNMWASKRSCTKKELESFLGHLAIILRPGRTFLRHLFSLLHSRRAPHHWIRLDTAAKADLRWWAQLLQSWNGSSFFPNPIPTCHVYSDASGSYGCGALSEGLGWFRLAWPTSWVTIPITAKELVPIVIAAAVWGPHWSQQHICFHSDNSAVVALLQSLTSRDSLILHLIRCLSFFAALFRFHFTSAHVPGVLNTAADALSRSQMSLFLSFTPQAQETVIPPVLTHLLLDPRRDQHIGQHCSGSLWKRYFNSN